MRQKGEGIEGTPCRLCHVTLWSLNLLGKNGQTLKSHPRMGQTPVRMDARGGSSLGTKIKRELQYLPQRIGLDLT